MKLGINKFLLWAIAVAWIPYLGLTLYWRHLKATVQGADHGELSGPVQYFLPRLLALALLVSVASTSAYVVRRLFKKPAIPSPNSSTIHPELGMSDVRGAFLAGPIVTIIIGLGFGCFLGSSGNWDTGARFMGIGVAAVIGYCAWTLYRGIRHWHDREWLQRNTWEGGA